MTSHAAENFNSDGPFTVTKRITNTTYQIQDDEVPTVTKTVHRNHLVEYYSKEGSLPAMREKYVPSDHQDDSFYERFMEQRTLDLYNPSTTDERDSFPFPIQPLRSISSTNKPKRSSTYSNVPELLLHLLLLAPLCTHLCFLLKHQPPSILFSECTTCSIIAPGTSQSDSTIYS